MFFKCYINLSSIEAHIGFLYLQRKKCISIQFVYASNSNDYVYISLHETTELSRLVRQSNQVENVVTHIPVNYLDICVI